MQVLYAEGNNRARTVMIGLRKELPLGKRIVAGSKVEEGNEDDLCLFIDAQYGEEDIESLKKELRRRGLEFDDIIVFCG